MRSAHASPMHIKRIPLEQADVFRKQVKNIKLYKTKHMKKVLKYALLGLGILLALSNIGGALQGFGSPILWILMIVFLSLGLSIKESKS
jgi:FtsH-binding integral membrane protein